jgi:thiamine biosynthesis lipoprotein
MSDEGGVAAARDALDGIDRLEAQLTVFRETSEVALINRRAAENEVEVEPRLFELLRLCKQLHHETGGAFDITAGPLIRCWGFLRREGRVPDSTELERARELSGTPKMILDPARRTLRFALKGVEINLGSIGKGYALDCIGAEMRRRGVRSALVSGGSSSVLAIGGGVDGRGWAVGLRHPRLRDQRIAVLKLRDSAMATSGSAEQHFESGGKRYGHIIDPRSGMPAEGVASVTVVASSAALADGLATAFYVGGRELAERYCSTHSEVLALMIEESEPDHPILMGASNRCGVEIID